MTLRSALPLVRAMAVEESYLQRQLRYWMVRRGFNQKSLAKAVNDAKGAVGSNPTLIRDILSGRSKSPQHANITAIAKVLKIHPELLTGPVDKLSDDFAMATATNSRHIEVWEADIAALEGGPQVDDTGLTPLSYGFPAEWFDETFRAPPQSIKIITIDERFMEPDLAFGDKAIVNIDVQTAEVPGLYFVKEGTRRPLPRLIQPIPPEHAGEPERLLIRFSNPQLERYVREASMVKIMGRIVGVVHRF